MSGLVKNRIFTQSALADGNKILFNLIVFYEIAVHLTGCVKTVTKTVIFCTGFQPGDFCEK